MDKILAEFRKSGRSAFWTREYAALLGKPSYARLNLHRLKARNELVSVRNGWWAFPDALPEAVACEISKPCYLSFHSALYLHNLTTQIPRLIQLAVVRYGRSYRVFGNLVKEYKINRGAFNNFSSKGGLLLASPEKAFADCLNLPRSCPEIVLREVLPEVNRTKVKDFILPAAKKRFERLLNA